MTGLVVQRWPIDRLVEYRRNPRKNDAIVDKMCGAIRSRRRASSGCAKSPWLWPTIFDRRPPP